jgi:DNA-binding NtrC family response regulator
MRELAVSSAIIVMIERPIMTTSQRAAFGFGLSTTVMVVEDEMLVRMALADYLKDCGFGVIEAANADEAVAMIAEPTVSVDLVFTDVRMPGTMDGFGLANWLREHRKNLPVILTSGDVGPKNIDQKVLPGEAFFPKPYRLENVAAKIAQTLARATGQDNDLQQCSMPMNGSSQ